MLAVAEFPVLESIQAELDAHVLGILEKGCLRRLKEKLFGRRLLENYSNWLKQKRCLLF